MHYIKDMIINGYFKRVSGWWKLIVKLIITTFRAGLEIVPGRPLSN